MTRLKSKVDASQIEKEYEEGLNYKKQMGFPNKWAEYERFKAGDQWAPATEKTKHLPRPVFNIISYICKHKVASVVNQNIKMIYTPQESFNEEVEEDLDEDIKQAIKGANIFTRYSDTIWENLKQDELNEEALESGANIGTAIWHYYWDTDKKGGITTPYIGDISGETIDSMNIFFGNPQQIRVQKQPYIIISSRELVSNIRKEAKENGAKPSQVINITSDSKTQEEGYDSAKYEVQSSDKTTVLTKYWKQDGKVYFCKVSSGVVVKPPTDTDLTLYPIVVMQWERRKKSIFGIGDTEGLIPNQKGINFLMAMQLLAVQQTGFPKVLYKSGMVDPNKLNNDPSVPIEDRSPPGTGDGVKYLTPGHTTPLATNLVEAFMNHTKSLSSAHDVATGDIGKGDLNASAINLLQKASGVPIESIKKRFYRAMEEVGLIWLDFWRTKYNTTRRINIKDDEGKEESVLFNGEEYAKYPMNLKIDIGSSSSYSEELMLASLDKLYDRDAITLEDYLEFAPKTVVPFKDRLLKRLKERQEQPLSQPQQFLNNANQNQSPLGIPMQDNPMMTQEQPSQAPDQVGQSLQYIRESVPELSELTDEELMEFLAGMKQGGIQGG